MNKFITTILFAILIMIFIYIWTNNSKKRETFDIVLADSKLGMISKVNLQHFFQFIEYFQTADVDINYSTADPGRRINFNSNDEATYIRNNILTMLKMLDFIVNTNEKDNYYSRFLVIKVGSNLQYSKQFPFRRQNYEELVNAQIGRQFTFLPQNEYDKYSPRASHQSQHQYPLPNTVNVHNYYTTTNTEVNLMALKMLLENVHGDEPDRFKEIFHPTEHPAFLTEFMIPLKMIKNNILHIVNTNSYIEYLKTQKYNDQYKDTLFRINEEI